MTAEQRKIIAAIARYLVQGHLRHTCLHCPLVRYGAETECKQATRNGGCQDTRLVTGVKRDLARTDFMLEGSTGVVVDSTTLVLLQRMNRIAHLIGLVTFIVALPLLWIAWVLAANLSRTAHRAALPNGRRDASCEGAARRAGAR